MFRILAHCGQGNLMSTECAFNGHAIHFFRASPALRSAQDDHGPRRTWIALAGARIFLNVSYPRVAAIESSGKKLMHDFGIIPFDEIWGIAEPLVVQDKFFVTRACQDRGARDFVTIQMQNRQHCSVPQWVQELNALPASFERAGLGLAITDDA